MMQIIDHVKRMLPMAWNEPGKGNDKQDPPNPWGKGRETGPPDLDQLLRKLKEKIKAFFGNQKKPNFSNFSSMSSNKQNGSGPRNPSELKTMALVIGGALLFLYLLAGIYIVDPPERAVVTRLGQYVRTEGPGPHWIPVILESREIVNVEQVATSDHSGLMLTKDRNIASVGIAVQYRIGEGVDDVRSFLFNVVNPIHSLKQSAESALRQVVGQSTMDEVLTLKRSEIATQIKEQIVETLKQYNTGIMVLDVSMQFAKAPDEVRAAFDEVIKAAADEERLVNLARAYENEVLPRARGKVEQLKNEALGYKQEITLKAEGNVQRFNSILPEYQKAPRVTQTRLYLDAMEQILSKVTKIVADQNGGNNFIYIPMEKQSGNQEAVPLLEPESAISYLGSGSNKNGGGYNKDNGQQNSNVNTMSANSNENSGTNSRSFRNSQTKNEGRRKEKQS